MDAVKRGGGVTLAPTRDGRVHLGLACASVLSWPKFLFLLLCAFAALSYVSAPLLGVEGMRRRVVDLERRLARRLAGALRSRSSSASSAAAGRGGGLARPASAHADGRQHLLTPAGAPSALASALAASGAGTGLAAFDEHYLCGSARPAEAEVARKTIALAAISWRAPLSLRNSMASWAAGGLLDLADERMIFLNSPTPEDVEIASAHGFDIYTTEERGGNVKAGPALAYLVGNTSADYVLLLEKDFVLSAPRAAAARELWTGVQLLARGVDGYRLRGKTDFPAEGMPDCCAAAEPPNCPYNSGWRGAGTFSDHQNWLLIYCDPDILEHSAGRLAQCAREPDAASALCYTSWESNWSNNPILFPAKWFNEKVRSVALSDMDQNHLFEFNVMLSWLEWDPPAIICSSEQGIFTHNEIDQ